MRIQLIAVAANPGNFKQEINRIYTPGHPVRIKAQPGIKISAIIDGIEQTGSQWISGKKPVLKKIANDLAIQIDGETVAQITDFYSSPGAVLEGASWNYSGAETLAVSESQGSVSAAGEAVRIRSDVSALPAADPTASGWPDSPGGFALLGVLGAGGGGGGAAAAATAAVIAPAVVAPTTFELSVMAAAGPVKASLAYQVFDASGLVVASGKTAADGSVSGLKLDKSYNGQAMLVVLFSTNGAGIDYRDEAGGADKSLPIELRGIFVADGRDKAISITPATELLVRMLGVNSGGPLPDAATVDLAVQAVGQALGLVDSAGKSTVLGSFTTVFGADYNEADGLNDAEKYAQLLARLSGLDARNGGDTNLTLNQLLSEINSGGVASAVLAQMLEDGAAIFKSGPNAGLATLTTANEALMAPSSYNVAAAKARTDAGELADGLLNGLEAADDDGTILHIALPGRAMAGGQVTLTIAASGAGAAQTVSHVITLADVVQGYVSLFVSEAQLTASGEGVKIASAEIANVGGAPFTVTTAAFSYDASAPTINLGPVAGDNSVNLAEKDAGVIVSGTVLGGEAGQTIVVTWSNSTQSAVLGNGREWNVVFLPNEVPANGSGPLTARVTDAAGNTASAKVTIAVDTAVPTLTISNVTADNTISAAEKPGGVNVSGSSEGVENGQMATVTWGVTTKTASVLNNLWSAIFTSGEVPADGSTTITADVHDLAGNPATQQTQAVTVATGLPSITINPVTGDDKVNLAEKTDGVTISGSTDIDNGQEITVQWGGGAHKTATVTDGAWHVDYTSAEVPSDGSVNITAHGSNLAGNAAIDALKSLTVDTEEPPQPQLALGSGIAGGATSAEATQSGGLVIVSAEDGAGVSVVFAGPSGGVTKMLPGTGAAMAVALSAGDLAALGDGMVNVSSVATDSAGNASITANISFTLDTVHPTVAVTSNASTLQAGETAIITFSFSEDPGITFDAASVAVTGGEIGETSGTGFTRIATFTPTAAITGTATVSVANGKFADAAGNFNSDGGDANNTVAMAVDTLHSVSLMSSDWSSGFPQYGDQGVFPGL